MLGAIVRDINEKLRLFCIVNRDITGPELVTSACLISIARRDLLNLAMRFSSVNELDDCDEQWTVTKIRRRGSHSKCDRFRGVLGGVGIGRKLLPATHFPQLLSGGQTPFNTQLLCWDIPLLRWPSLSGPSNRCVGIVKMRWLGALANELFACKGPEVAFHAAPLTSGTNHSAAMKHPELRTREMEVYRGFPLHDSGVCKDSPSSNRPKFYYSSRVEQSQPLTYIKTSSKFRSQPYNAGRANATIRTRTLSQCSPYITITSFIQYCSLLLVPKNIIT